eukprot:1712745-Pyramimonas_sp.AAC.1
METFKAQGPKGDSDLCIVTLANLYHLSALGGVFSFLASDPDPFAACEFEHMILFDGALSPTAARGVLQYMGTNYSIAVKPGGRPSKEDSPLK